jgi:hypothetical protein
MPGRNLLATVMIYYKEIKLIGVTLTKPPCKNAMYNINAMPRI